MAKLILCKLCCRSGARGMKAAWRRAQRAPPAAAWEGCAGGGRKRCHTTAEILSSAPPSPPPDGLPRGPEWLLFSQTEARSMLRMVTGIAPCCASEQGGPGEPEASLYSCLPGIIQRHNMPSLLEHHSQFPQQDPCPQSD